MSTMKIRKKSRFNQASDGASWSAIWKFGRGGKRGSRRAALRKRLMVQKEREEEAQRRTTEDDIDWDEVRELLDEGLDLNFAKLMARTVT